MIIMGVDPGTLITGYGVIALERNRFRIVECECIRNKRERSMPLRLQEIFESLQGVIERCAPDEFAIESAFYGKNAQSALKIGLARGAAILAAVTREVPVTEYTPREIKKAVAGNGGATKEQVRYMVKTILSVERLPSPYDASDALATALCHSRRLISPAAQATAAQQKRAGSWAAFVNQNPERIVRR